MKNQKANFRIFLFIISLALSISLLGCFDQIKSPVVPSWDVEYSLPLLNRTEIIKDRIKGSKGIFIDSTTQELLLKLDSSEVKSQTLEKFFSDNISFDEDFSIRTNQVDTVSFESYIVDDSVYVEQMNLYKGTIEIKVTNHLNKAADINFTVSNFSKLVQGRRDTLKFDMRINAGATSTKNIDLSGYNFSKININPITGLPSNGIYVYGIAKIVPGYQGDSISVNMKLQNLGFNYVKGKFKPYESELKTKTNKLDVDDDLRDLLPKIQLYGAKLIFSPNVNSQNLEIRLKNFQVIGKFINSQLQPKLLKINNRTTLDTVFNLSQNQIEFNLDDIAINEFISPQIPDSITYKGDVIINPNYKSLEASFPDTIKFTNRLIAYSIFRIDNASRTDTIEVDFNQNEQDNIDKLNFAELNISYDNSIPLGFKISGRFLDASNNTLFYFTKERSDGSPSDTVFSIQPSRINADGLTVESSKQVKKFSLTRDEFLKLKRAKKSIINVVFYSSEGKKVKMSAKDRIAFKVSVKMKART
jgi:hypothetical protein